MDGETRRGSFLEALAVFLRRVGWPFLDGPLNSCTISPNLNCCNQLGE